MWAIRQSGDYSFIEVNRRLRHLYPEIIAETISGIERAGGTVFREAKSDLIRVNDEFTVSIVLARCEATASGSLRWNIRLDAGLSPDITVAIRMNRENDAALDYYFLPKIDVCFLRLRLSEFNGISLDAYRFDSLQHFFDLTARTNILEVSA